MHDRDKDELKSLFLYNNSINQRLIYASSVDLNSKQQKMCTIARFELSQETGSSCNE